ncbi:cytochrome c [Magnetovibrio sp. PR-2]|uniref:c-type cytochrome n=1 Tax=Magnetovibrio sp. PR-2 TaxID=3120356 RepID=UPI002FCE6426
MAKWTDHLPKLAVAVIVLGGAAVLVSKVTGGNTAIETVNVNVPTKLSVKAERGAKVFADNCAACHGDSASGSDKGPPLIHNIYNPGHHGDESFFLAMQQGVRQHHWPYGNMPPQKQVNATMAGNIITYIRELQAANGIVYQQHRM